MIYNKSNIFKVIILLLAVVFASGNVPAKSTRVERRKISQGNEAFSKSRFVEAASLYEEALADNPQSVEATYNLGLANLRQIKNPKDTIPSAKAIADKARKNMTAVAATAKTKPALAAKANYNLGNLEFNAGEFEKAIGYYKQALRIDPSDNAARRNLRIAQLNLKKQDQNKNQDQHNKENQQDKDQERNQENNKSDQNQNKQEKPKDGEMSQQASQQVLNAVENKESQTRARLQQAAKGDKRVGGSSSRKRW